MAASTYVKRALDARFSSTGAGTILDPIIPNVNVTGVVAGDVVVDFTALNTKIDQLKALIGTAGDDQNDATVIGVLIRIALATEALA